MDSSKSRLEVLDEELRLTRQRLADLERSGKCRLEDFEGPDRELMKYVFLFVIFHQCAEDFDRFIERQSSADEHNLAVWFAPGVLKQLRERGFSEEESERCFSMFYQIRRAYYLIGRMLIGPSSCMRRLRMHLWNHIFTQDLRLYERYLWDKMEDFSTLLEGPTGSGKGAAAAAIGRSGYIPYEAKKNSFVLSFTRQLVEVNLAQFTPTLLESELFGHAKGAFTGAVGDYGGVLSLCGRHGTIFLDEIGEIRPNVQVKLLRVLQERRYWPVGSHQERVFWGRVVGATNQPVEALRRGGRFRDDFYYRLCADIIRVPSLKERIEESEEELGALVRHFVEQIAGSADEGIAGRVLEVIGKRLGRGYGWPGNVRELAQCIRRVILRGDYEPWSGEPSGASGEGLTAEALLRRYCRQLYERYGNYGQAAKVLGLNWRTVKRYVEGGD
jgi:transcriptional regulator of acetoin/glycerol metabolism